MAFIFIAVLYIGINAYVALRMSETFRSAVPKTIFFIIYAVLAFSVVIYFAFSGKMSGTARNFWSAVYSVWLGVFVYLLLFTILKDVIITSGILLKFIPRPIPQIVKIISNSAVIILTAIVVIYGTVNASNVKVKHYDINTGKLDKKIKIALVSDIHLGALGSNGRLPEAVDKINSEKPDIICIAGDIFNDNFSSVQNPDFVSEQFKRLKSTYGVYACLGNHDAGSAYKTVKNFLKKSGISLLSEECEDVGNVTLAGRLDARPIGSSFGAAVRKNTAELLENAEKEKPLVVLDHNPANIGEYKDNADLILCGHTHKGQIFPGSLFTNAMYDVDYGYYRKDEKSPQVIVTSGLGTWGMPMRVGTDSEIVIVELN